METKRFIRRSLAFGLFCLASPAFLGAQVSQKQPLTHESYDIWRSIGGQALANNGEWIAYVVSPREGDGVMTLRSIGGRQTLVGTVDRASGPRITPDSRFLIYTIEPMQAVVDSLEEAGERGDALPRDSMAVMVLSSAFGSGGTLNEPGFKMERIRSWQIPSDEGAYLAYMLENEVEEPDSASEGEEAAGAQAGRGGRAGAGQAGRGGRAGAGRGGAAAQEGDSAAVDRRKAEGYRLMLRNLETGQETEFEDVTSYRFTDAGDWLLYLASNEDGTADGVYAVSTSSGEVSPILSGEGEYSQMALSDDNAQIAFLTNRDDWEADEPAFTIYHAILGEGEARPVATEGTAGIPEGWWVSESSLSFSDSGGRLFFNTAPRPPAEDEDAEEIPEDEQVVVDIWNWKDPLIQPMQLVRANRDRNQTYMAYASTDDYHVVQLGTEEIPSINISQGRDGDIGLGTASDQYGPMQSYDGTYGDVYLFDVATGEREMILEKQRSPGGSFSPGGKYLTWWDGFAMNTMIMDLETREVRNLTEAIPYPVYDELEDQPTPPGSYGTAGWLKDDEGVLVYDYYDIWWVDPTGSQPPRNVTEGVGRDNDIRFRYVNMNAGGGGGGRGGGGGGSEGIDPSEDALLSAFGYHTKQEGFYRDRFDGNRAPQQLLLDNYNFGNPQKAEDADVYIMTRSTFEEFPDLWITDPDFQNWEKISDANPQQEEYSWGSAEILDWVSNDGTPLQGILIKPEDFDPSRKYPMMVYFYERSSDGLHSYRAPNAGGSVNPTFYVSRGYVFFIPDIPYEIGHPGESAIDAVVPGILKLVDLGFVDKDRIGVQGHSWGGYQIAYMVTRSNIFAAAEAGAPVANMTSAYGGIRWGTGMSRQFQYERTQSRIGGTLWEETLTYINNSPLFEADKVQTPLLILHNDQDDAVPWYQGIELYMALRRLEKPVWLVNYNGEPHGIRKRQNQKDFTIRMQQFFDHYLKGDPPAVWMVDGVPAVMKGKTLGLELVKGGGM